MRQVARAVRMWRLVAVVLALTFVACGGDEMPTPIPSATPASATATPQPSPSPASDGIWRPSVGTTWQWQLSGLPIDLSVDVEMYDIDLFDNDADVVDSLQARGRKVVCYLSAGSWEDWRPDAPDFPDTVLGTPLAEWEGERWLDIRRLDLLGPIMEARMDLCETKGFDAVEPDNIDGYLNDTGFPLTYDDQVEYNLWLAEAAHERGLSIGLKNDSAQIADLLPHFDWALNEQCFEFDECQALLPFIDAGKAVFNVEYALDVAEFCIEANALKFSAIVKNLDLDAWRQPCVSPNSKKSPAAPPTRRSD